MVFNSFNPKMVLNSFGFPKLPLKVLTPEWSWTATRVCTVACIPPGHASRKTCSSRLHYSSRFISLHGSASRGLYGSRLISLLHNEACKPYGSTLTALSGSESREHYGSKRIHLPVKEPRRDNGSRRQALFRYLVQNSVNLMTQGFDL